ncbi:MAG: hypothetical protein LBJ76_02950, partial [Candidatus Accumulibacter sp.]|nr:hypothetical protein [Accumulibacter sp.]
MNLILSTCGTSILTNGADEDLRKLFAQHANVRDSGVVPAQDRSRICAHIETRKRQFAQASHESARRDSAELNGILSFYGAGSFAENRRDIHYLLATDTLFGEVTAGIVKGWLDNHGFADVRVERRPDLQTADCPLFKSALSDLVKWCAEVIAPQKTAHCRVV